MIDTIVIIGNGFDRWLGLNTSYSDFHKYYLEHRDELVKKKHRMELEAQQLILPHRYGLSGSRGTQAGTGSS